MDPRVKVCRHSSRSDAHDATQPHRAADKREPQRGVTAAAFAVLRRHRGALAGATVRAVGLSGLAGLLMTAAIFALAWPLFTRMRDQRIWYHQVKDSYLHDHTDLALVALCTLPLFLLLLGTSSAALQSVCIRAVAAGTHAPEELPGIAPRLLDMWSRPVADLGLEAELERRV
ncbi:hypothetical protein ACIHCV_45420, partial [Streptomyces sp. NPDC051956]